MTPLVQAARHLMLDALTRQTAPSIDITHLSLHTAWHATGLNETTGGAPAYARQSITWDAPAADASNSSNTQTFDVPSGDVHFAGMWSAVTAGTFFGMVIANAAAPVAAQAFDLVNEDITSENHGLSADDRIVFHPTRGGALPTGISEGTIYFVITAGLVTDMFRVSTTSEGAALNISGDGKMWYQIGTPENFAGQGQYTVNDFDIDELN